MVALLVRSIDCRPVTCLARPELFRAHDALERGHIIEAGVRLREAVRLYLVAECEWQGCLPSEKQQRSCPRLIAAIKKVVPNFGAAWLEEILEAGNKAAHCVPVDAEHIERCLRFAHMFLDHAPYLVQPTTAGRLG